jgi:hypothetical protein
VKNASASKIQWAADNFVGTVTSYIQKANIADDDGNRYIGNSIEWIREDTKAIIDNDPTGASFPSPPGSYFITFTGDREFVVDPLLDVFREFLVEFPPNASNIGATVTLEMEMAHPGTLFIFTAENLILVEGTHYTVDYPTGVITFITDLSNYLRMYADYKYPVDSRGPFTIEDVNTFNNTAIPGVVIAFGRSMHEGDRCAIIVTPKREIQALEYGGKWEVNVSFDVLAQDPIQMEEIADLVLMYVWGEKKDKLEFEGLIIMDISHGGEADEVYDETGQNLYYMVSMDLTVESDWNIHVPVPFRVQAIEFVADLQSFRTATDEEVLTIDSSLRVVPSLVPYMPKAGLSHNFERIT